MKQRQFNILIVGDDMAVWCPGAPRQPENLDPSRLKKNA
jgi:hypothetical protein